MKFPNPFKGKVYRPGLAFPEPDYETANGRLLYTKSAMEKMFMQGSESSHALLVRARNLLSQPAHWGADDEQIKSRYALYTEIQEHIAGEKK